MKKIELSLGEEIANAITHGIGAVLSISALVLLITAAFKNGNAAVISGVFVFGISMFFLYMMSTLCHSFGLMEGTARKVFEILDYSAIYVFIAGTYTLFCLSIIGGMQGYIVLAIQWALAIVGIVLRTVFYGKYVPLHLAIYVAMGWMMVIFIKSITAVVPSLGMLLLLVGGLFYTGGIIFYAIRMFKYHHMIWHLCVLAGTACHFFMVYLYVLPRG